LGERKMSGTRSSILHAAVMATVVLVASPYYTALAADFSRANLSGAHLTNADLRGSDLSGANLAGADLSGSDIRETNITQQQLDSACGSGTRLPAGLRISPCLAPDPPGPSADEVGRRMMTSAASAGGPSAITSTPTQSPETKMSFVGAIQDEATSVIREAPKCTDKGLRGMLVMATPPRPGFPLDATTFASPSPSRTFTTVTTKGENVAEVDSSVDAIGKVLNTRAANYLKQLMRGCSF
jgi:hypothetical protein